MTQHNGWVKLHRRILADEKVRSLCLSRRWIFASYVMLAQHDGRWRGYLTHENGKPMTCTELAAAIGDVDKAGISRANNTMLTVGLLEQTDGGRLKIRNYDKYQSKSVVEMQQDGPENKNGVANGVAEMQQNVAFDVAEVQQSSTTCRHYKKEEEKEESSDTRVSSDYAGCSWCKPPGKQSPVQALVQCWHDECKRVTGVCWTPTQRHFGNLRTLLTSRTAEQVTAMVRYWFAGYGEWCEYGFGNFTSDPSRVEIAMRTAPKNGGKRECSREAEFDEAARLLGIEVMR